MPPPARALLALSVLALSALLSPPVIGNAPREAVVTYPPDPTGPVLTCGVACVPIRPGETVLTVVVEDDVFQHVQGFLQIDTVPNGGVVEYFCDRITVPIPANHDGDVRVSITTYPPYLLALGALSNGLECVQRVGTTGTIRVQFS